MTVAAFLVFAVGFTCGYLAGWQRQAEKVDDLRRALVWQRRQREADRGERL